ncbi:MAG: hypothetical protein LQ338_002359 [Usnochroma carphineum]|nr:MAG: hypothetical protein LQ338_002359 [Usnochroma carphineum]
MSHEENIQIFVTGVEDARREQQARGHEVGPAVDFKLTVDLSKRNLYEVPQEVVELLRAEVERSQLLSLPQLEILDLSVNEIRAIPDSIRSMRSLRVLSLTKNKIWNVPSCIKDLDTLRMLKLAGNPLRSDLASIVEAKDTQLSFDEAATDNEKETFITSSLKHHLKVKAAHESGEGSSEGPLETPRPFMRNGSLRFPVKTNGSASESASEARSPGFARPAIPARSHFRVTSGQNHMMQKSGTRRPGLSPLHIGSERNRSNSESVLQTTQNNRSKRMGMVPKKKNDLGTVEESRQSRNSWHLRGKSHASALRDWKPEGELDDSGTGGGNGTSRQRLHNTMHPAGTFVRHLTKRQKHRKQRMKPRLVDATIAVRYSLSAFDQCTSCLIESLPNRPPKSWVRLKDAQHEASFRVAGLHHSVNSLIQESQVDPDHHSLNKRTASLSFNACNSAIGRYIRLANLLLDKSTQVLADGGGMYIRTLVLQTLGSSAEVFHAFQGIRRPCKRRTAIKKRPILDEAPFHAPGRALHDESLRDQSLTPTRERPVTAKRVQNWHMLQKPNSPNNIKQTGLSHFPMAQPAAPRTAGLPSTIPQPAVPLYFNGRSRSNSRADQYNLPSGTDSTFALSPAMTPSSMGAFSIPGTPLNRSRSSSVAAGGPYNNTGRITPTSTSAATTNTYFDPDPELHLQFSKIQNLLDQLVQLSRKALPRLKEHLIRALTAAQTGLDQATCEQWAKRVRACSLAAELSSIMLKRLQGIYGLEHSTGHHAWNEKSFWELCKKFLAAVSDLLMDVRAGYREGYILDDVVNLMRPISSVSRSVSHEIQDSPWNSFLSGPALAASPRSMTGSAYSHYRQRRSSGSNSYAASVPPTPLSAALGPAAQATVPSTPASSGSLERSFQGGWVERADALQQMQQTMVYRR